MTSVDIVDIQYYLPDKKENLKSLKKINPDWKIDSIIKKTGINNRYISNLNETALDLAFKATNKISKDKLKDIDNLIYVTQSPEYSLPTTACILQQKMKLNNKISCFDINQGCSGFVYALAVGSSMISSGISKKTLIVCSDTYTKYISKKDRTNRPIFSDGASTVLLKKSKNLFSNKFQFETYGESYKELIVENSGARFSVAKGSQELYMNGSNVLLFTLSKVPIFVEKFLKSNKLSINDIDKFIFHQASEVVLESLRYKLGIPKEKMPTNYQIYGNTVSSTIPILIKDLFLQKKIKNNETALLVGFGVGLSIGIGLVKF